VLRALFGAGREGDWARVHHIYSRFAALIVFEQQPGLAIRKEILRRRGLLSSARVRHPGQTITAAQSAQLDTILSRTLPGVDIAQPIRLEQLLGAWR
jgi:4-hydroxy-tetrahydrodipicolinate synthase